MKNNKKKLESVGVVLDRNLFSESHIGMYVTFDSNDNIINQDREEFTGYVIADIKKRHPEINLDTCQIISETGLYINFDYYPRLKKEELIYTVAHDVICKNESGQIVYNDVSDGFTVELSDTDKKVFNRIILEELEKAMLL